MTVSAVATYEAHMYDVSLRFESAASRSASWARFVVETCSSSCFWRMKVERRVFSWTQETRIIAMVNAPISVA